MKLQCPKEIPKLPGVYLFKDAQGAVLYIGKAKNLKNRVCSYFTNNHTDWKIVSLLKEYETVAHIVTATEHDALILEAQLVQQYQPKYNRLLKAGQPFLYIVHTKEPLPTFAISRNKKKKGIYFGPFIHKAHTRKALQFLMDTFQLNVCNKTIENGCIYYHINKCAGTCKSDFAPNAYKVRAALALNVLQQKRDPFLQTIEHEIQQCNQTLQFERARHLHRYKETINFIFETLHRHITHAHYVAEVTNAIIHKQVETNKQHLATEIQKLFNLNHPVHTIDCFDVSHFQSSALVGSCVRFVNGKPDKNKFRKFNIKTLDQQNDYAALQEIVTRRYKDGDIPDLILIDGGIGQLNAIKHVMPNAPLTSIAKREERIFSTTLRNRIVLNKHDEAAQIIIALRDYAHHFAITYHRLKRTMQ